MTKCEICGKEIEQNGGRGRKKKYCSEHSYHDTEKKKELQRRKMVDRKRKERKELRKIDGCEFRSPFDYSSSIDRSKLSFGTFSFGSNRKSPFMKNGSLINESKEIRDLEFELNKIRSWK